MNKWQTFSVFAARDYINPKILEKVWKLGEEIVPLIEKMKENVKTTKDNSEELFNSLMSKAFRGEL